MEKRNMGSIEEWLAIGDLRSDGAANEVVNLVLMNPESIDDLLLGLSAEDKVVRGHAADALEKVSRVQPGLLLPHVDMIAETALHDEVAMVRWHLAMILGYLSRYEAHLNKIIDTLFRLLNDASVFVKSWSIVSLCIIAREYTQFGGAVLEKIERLKGSESVAIRTKVRQAQGLILNPEQSFPKGWIKSRYTEDIE